MILNIAIYVNQITGADFDYKPSNWKCQQLNTKLLRINTMKF